jgi:hypothetical protein
MKQRIATLVVLGGSCLLVLPSVAQSLGEVARASRTSKKATRVITNDTLPEAKGPANGAAISPLTKAALEESLPPNDEKSQASSKAGDSGAGAKVSQQGQAQKELRERINFLNGQVTNLNARMESESNEATRDAMQHLAATYQSQRDEAQQQLDV